MITFASVLLGFSSLFAQPVGQYLPADHVALVNAAMERGVEVRVNTNECVKQGDVHGYYSWSLGRSELVICQANAQQRHVEVRWTENDLDTLRHEIVHMIQDCNVGGIADGKMKVLLDLDELENHTRELMPTGEIASIVEGYKSQGATDYEIMKELEAFLVAKYIKPEAILATLNKTCALK